MERVPFHSPELNRQNPKVEVDSAKEALTVLQNQELKDEILAGNVTLAMIRPHLGPAANVLNLTDQEAADEIEKMIEGLGMMTKFSVKFDPAIVAEFYSGGPRASMLEEPPQEPALYDSRWPEFIDFMSSAPTTIVLLHSPDHDAIEKWRVHLGHWNIDEFRDPTTIRGKLGVNKYNNLVHGSDSSAAIIREIGIISRQLEKSISDQEAREHTEKALATFRGEQSENIWFAETDILGDPSDRYEVVPHNGWRRLGGESYVMDFSVLSETEQHHLVAKACVKIPPGAVMNEWLGRRQLLNANGISTPRLYAVQGATLLEEFIPFSLGEAYRQSSPQTQELMRTSFFESYLKLYELGFKPMRLHDLRSRGDDVVFIDFGEDLGGIFEPSLPKDIESRTESAFSEIIKK